MTTVPFGRGWVVVVKTGMVAGLRSILARSRWSTTSSETVSAAVVGSQIQTRRLASGGPTFIRNCRETYSSSRCAGVASCRCASGSCRFGAVTARSASMWTQPPVQMRQTKNTTRRVSRMNRLYRRIRRDTKGRRNTKFTKKYHLINSFVTFVRLRSFVSMLQTNLLHGNPMPRQEFLHLGNRVLSEMEDACG